MAGLEAEVNCRFVGCWLSVVGCQLAARISCEYRSVWQTAGFLFSDWEIGVGAAEGPPAAEKYLAGGGPKAQPHLRPDVDGGVARGGFPFDHDAGSLLFN